MSIAESLVWFKVSGFRYTIDAGVTGTLLGYPFVALYCGNPAALGPKDWFLHVLQQITDEVDIYDVFLAPT